MLNNSLLKCYIVIIIALFGYFNDVFAQEQESNTLSVAKAKRKESYDSTYIRQYRNQWCVTLLGVKRDFFIDITNPTATRRSLSFSPKNQYSWGLGLDYKWFTVEFTMKYPFPQVSKSQSQSLQNNFGIRVGLTRQKFWFSSFYQQYRGMNINFSADTIFQTHWTSLPSFRNDIFSSSLHLSVNYGFNNQRYSQMAALWQIDRQLKSAGTFVVGISSFFYRLEADSTLIPRMLNRYFNKESQVQKSVTKNIGINLGYSHTFVIRKKFFVHLSLIPSVAYQYREYNIVQNDDIYVKGLSISTEARGILGYNSEKWYGGINFANYSFTENSITTGSGAVLNYNFWRWFVGFRLKPTFKISANKQP